MATTVIETSEKRRFATEYGFFFLPPRRVSLDLTLTTLFWKAEGGVSPGFGTGLAGLSFVLPRGPGSGESAVAHKGSPPHLSGGELGVGAEVRGYKTGLYLDTEL